MIKIVEYFFIFNIIFIPFTISDKTLKTFRQTDKLNNVLADYNDYAQMDPRIFLEKTAQYQQLQDNENQRKKGQLTEENIKEETEKLNNSYTWQSKWPTSNIKLGAVSAVTFDPKGNVVIFHRGNHIWNSQSFSVDNIYVDRNKGNIIDNTVIAFNHKTGEVIYEWGKNMFYMPHGLTIDHEYNVWVTDVALHQVMKFSSNNMKIDTNPLLVLGTAFKPGNGRDTFCKPTSVAVLPNGEFFVADGYCNARIIKFSKDGNRILKWGENSFQGTPKAIAPENFFAVPHGLTLASDKNLICVADRENGRVQCFRTVDGSFHSQYHSPLIGDRLFSVSYAPIDGGQLFVVNGPVVKMFHEISGFIISMSTGEVISKFSPNNTQFSNPHDIVVSKDGKEIYVAELDPNKVHKFVLTSSIGEQQIDISSTSESTHLSDQNQNLSSVISKNENSTKGFLVLISILICVLIIFIIALILSRRRKRGCLAFGKSYRRHAWDFPTGKQGDGFKLGNLLDRKRGFEKLNQDASDDEPSVTTNMLSNSQFA